VGVIYAKSFLMRVDIDEGKKQPTASHVD